MSLPSQDSPQSSFTSITCSVIDRRNGQRAIGMPVRLRRTCPGFRHLVWRGITNANGSVLYWEAEDTSNDNLIAFLSKNPDQQMCWHMRFHTSDYFAPISPEYSAADVLFTLRQGDESPNIALYADLRGFGTWIAPLQSSIMSRNPVAQRRHRFSNNQSKALMDHFVDEPYPGPEAYQQLSGILNLRVEPTKKWFERRRHQQKQALRRRYLQTVTEENGSDQSISNENTSEFPGVAQSPLLTSRDFHHKSPYSPPQAPTDHGIHAVGEVFRPSISDELVNVMTKMDCDSDVELKTPSDDPTQEKRGVVALGNEMEGMTILQRNGRSLRRSTRRRVVVQN